MAIWQQPSQTQTPTCIYDPWMKFACWVICLAQKNELVIPRHAFKSQFILFIGKRKRLGPAYSSKIYHLGNCENSVPWLAFFWHRNLKYTCSQLIWALHGLNIESIRWPWLTSVITFQTNQASATHTVQKERSMDNEIVLEKHWKNWNLWGKEVLLDRVFPLPGQANRAVGLFK